MGICTPSALSCLPERSRKSRSHRKGRRAAWAAGGTGQGEMQPAPGPASWRLSSFRTCATGIPLPIIPAGQAKGDFSPSSLKETGPNRKKLAPGLPVPTHAAVTPFFFR
uniref:Uncharacterized protein n=1 Tax=Micrurus corallinus TaxID=54390 RepID=A0A2D4H0W9_MICCO